MLKEDAVKGIGVDAVCSIEGKHNSRTHNGLLFFFGVAPLWLPYKAKHKPIYI